MPRRTRPQLSVHWSVSEMRTDQPMTIREALEFEARWAREHREDVADQVTAQPSELATEDELADAWR